MSGEVVSAIVSRVKDQGFESNRRRSNHPVVEMGARALLEWESEDGGE